MKGKLIIIYVIFVAVMYGKTANQYWEELKVKADKIYSGLDVSFDISAGISNDENDRETVGELTFNIPLYSSSEKRKKVEEKQGFLQKGAELIKAVEVGRRYLTFLKDQKMITKATAYENGADGALEYFEVEKKIIETEEGIKEAERVLEGMLR